MARVERALRLQGRPALEGLDRASGGRMARRPRASNDDPVIAVPAGVRRRLSRRHRSGVQRADAAVASAQRRAQRSAGRARPTTSTIPILLFAPVRLLLALDDRGRRRRSWLARSASTAWTVSRCVLVDRRRLRHGLRAAAAAAHRRPRSGARARAAAADVQPDRAGARAAGALDGAGRRPSSKRRRRQRRRRKRPRRRRPR